LLIFNSKVHHLNYFQEISLNINLDKEKKHLKLPEQLNVSIYFLAISKDNRFALLTVPAW
jgi:hypothetical protein